MVRGKMTDAIAATVGTVTTATFLSCFMFGNICSDDCHAKLPTPTVFVDMMMMMMMVMMKTMIMMMMMMMMMVMTTAVFIARGCYS